MTRIALLGLAVGIVVLGSSGSGAVELTLDRAAIQRALAVARYPDAARSRFHELYTVRVDNPTVERVEVVTEFRRVVLAAEERVRFGDYLFGVREAEEVLRAWRGRLSLAAYLRFHPQNALGAVPGYDILVPGTADEPLLVPRSVQRTPVYGLASEDQSAPLLGAVVETVFDAASFAHSSREIVVVLPPKELVRVRVNFGSFQ